MLKKNIYLGMDLITGIDLIKYPLITDKTMKILNAADKYTFIVDPKISKPNIKKAIEFLFNVKVDKINTCHLAKKKSRVGQFTGMHPHYKKAIIKLKKGDTISYFLDN